MNLFDLSPDLIMDGMFNWAYQQAVKVLGDLFGTMNNFGVDLFQQPWVNQLISLFSKLGWALFLVGILVAIFEFAVESQNGQGNLKAVFLNVFKGFLAVNLFTILPVKLYGFTLNLQTGISADMTGSVYIDTTKTFAEQALDIVGQMFLGPVLGLFIILMMGYAVIKVFFSGLKRGGILLIQIAVGSLYMFSVPRGFSDGFYSWSKQVIALCLTTFLQSAMLICGLILFKNTWLLGLGVMLSAAEIPRIAGMFGLETTTKLQINSVINTVQSAVHLTQMVRSVAGK